MFDDGNEAEKRIMITCRMSRKRKLQEEVEVESRKDNFYTIEDNVENPLTTDYILIDSFKEETNELQVIPEHFDTHSVASVKSQDNAFVVKKSRKTQKAIYSESVTTKSLHTPDTESFLEVNKHFSRNTTLALLCCKTKNWNLMKALLELDPGKYPTLFSKDTEKFKCKDICLCKHHLYFQDDSKANCLHLALEDGQLDICQMIIDKVDV